MKNNIIKIIYKDYDDIEESMFYLKNKSDIIKIKKYIKQQYKKYGKNYEDKKYDIYNNTYFYIKKELGGKYFNFNTLYI